MATKAASPHDLLAIKNTLQLADMVKGSLGEETSKCTSLSEELQGLESFDEVVSEIDRSVSGNLATWNCKIKKGVSCCVQKLLGGWGGMLDISELRKNMTTWGSKVKGRARGWGSSAALVYMPFSTTTSILIQQCITQVLLCASVLNTGGESIVLMCGRPYCFHIVHASRRITTFVVYVGWW